MKSVAHVAANAHASANAAAFAAAHASAPATAFAAAVANVMTYLGKENEQFYDFRKSNRNTWCALACSTSKCCNAVRTKADWQNFAN